MHSPFMWESVGTINMNSPDMNQWGYSYIHVYIYIYTFIYTYICLHTYVYMYTYIWKLTWRRTVPSGFSLERVATLIWIGKWVMPRTEQKKREMRTCWATSCTAVHGWVMSRVNESCHTCEWVTTHMWMSRVLRCYGHHAEEERVVIEESSVLQRVAVWCSVMLRVAVCCCVL